MKKVLSFMLILLLCLSLAACGNDDKNQESKGNIEIKISVGSNEFIARLYDNETAQALINILPMTINMSELNNNEKYYYLLNNFPVSAANPGTIQAGDIMLYGSNCLVLFYKTFSSTYSYTKIGRIKDTTGLTAALGSRGVAVTWHI